MSRSFARSLQLIACLPVAVAGLAQAAPTCIPMAGFVRLDPDSLCAIAQKYQGPLYLGTAFGVPNACFKVTVRGPFGLTVIGTGSAGLTLEGHISPLVSSAGATPSMLNEAGLPPFVNELGFPETRRFFTGRSAIDMFGGRLYSADAGVLGPSGSTEQLAITGGTGTWTGAKGAIHTSGNLIGAWAPFSGQVCKP